MGSSRYVSLFFVDVLLILCLVAGLTYLIRRRLFFRKVFGTEVFDVAKITHKEWTEWYTFLITYTFEAPDIHGHTVTYIHKQQVSEATYDLLSTDMDIPIRYLPYDPAKTVLLADRYYEDRYAGCVLTTMVIIALLTFCFTLMLLFLPSLPQATTYTAQSHPPQLQAATYTGQSVPTSLPTRTSEQAIIQSDIQSHLGQWKMTQDHDVHSVVPAQLGLSLYHLAHIVYGYCPDGTFYVYAPKIAPNNGLDIRSVEFYGYQSQPDDSCHPPGWVITGRIDFGEGWSSGRINVLEGVPLPQ